MYSSPLDPGTELFQNHLHNFPFVEWLWGMGGRHIRSDTALNTDSAACSYACIQYPSNCVISRTGSATVYSLILPKPNIWHSGYVILHRKIRTSWKA